jgi:hypothetical protein
VADDLDRLDQLLADQEKSIRDAFRDFVASIGSPTVIEAIIARLEDRDIEGAMAIVDSYVARLGDVIPRVSLAVGTETAAELAAVVADSAPEITAAISFDPSHPRAAQLVRDHRAALVRDISAKQRASIQQAVSRAVGQGASWREAARAFRESIGLTAYQEQVVANYRAELTNLDRKALGRELRDRRRDPTVSRAIERSRPLTQSQIDAMVDRYRLNFRNMRAETIARTEGLQAVSEAREESLDQMIEQTGLDRSRIIERWNATRDQRTREWHASMDGQTRPRGEAFVDGLGQPLRYPGDPQSPANTRINCRCVKTFSIAAAR